MVISLCNNIKRNFTGPPGQPGPQGFQGIRGEPGEPVRKHVNGKILNSLQKCLFFSGTVRCNRSSRNNWPTRIARKGWRKRRWWRSNLNILMNLVETSPFFIYSKCEIRVDRLAHREVLGQEDYQVIIQISRAGAWLTNDCLNALGINN